MPRRIIAIMAGGRGERFWPQSRLSRPKHLLPIVGDKPMLAQTVDRLEGMAAPEDIFVITNLEQQASVREVCPGLPADNVVAEPVGRDTAAAVALAGWVARRRDPGASLALLPADHVVHDGAGFRATLASAFAAAEAGDHLVTIAIPPTQPETGFGYVERGEAVGVYAGREVFAVRRFVEKPSLEKAKEYLSAGTFYWNGGMFVWSLASLDKAFRTHAPEIASHFEAMERAAAAGRPLAEVLAEHYPSIPRISVDYALMEKARNVLTVPAGFDWDDVGAWPAVSRHFPADASGNVIRGDAVVEGGKGNLVISPGGHLTAVLGVDNLIVVHTPDATLVCPADKAQEIKKLLKQIESRPGGRQRL